MASSLVMPFRLVHASHFTLRLNQSINQSVDRSPEIRLSSLANLKHKHTAHSKQKPCQNYSICVPMVNACVHGQTVQRGRR